MRWRKRTGKSKSKVDPPLSSAAPAPVPIVIRSAVEARRDAEALLRLRPALVWTPPA